MILKTMMNWSPHSIGLNFVPNQKKLELDMKNCNSLLAKAFVEEALTLDLKALPSHLKYVFLG